MHELATPRRSRRRSIASSSSAPSLRNCCTPAPHSGQRPAGLRPWAQSTRAAAPTAGRACTVRTIAAQKLQGEESGQSRRSQPLLKMGESAHAKWANPPMRLALQQRTFHGHCYSRCCLPLSSNGFRIGRWLAGDRPAQIRLSSSVALMKHATSAMMAHELRTLITASLSPACAAHLTAVAIEQEYVRFQLTAAAPTARYPCRAMPPSSVHSHDQRHLTDLSWGSCAPTSASPCGSACATNRLAHAASSRSACQTLSRHRPGKAPGWSWPCRRSASP